MPILELLPAYTAAPGTPLVTRPEPRPPEDHIPENKEDITGWEWGGVAGKGRGGPGACLLISFLSTPGKD